MLGEVANLMVVENVQLAFFACPKNFLRGYFTALEQLGTFQWGNECVEENVSEHLTMTIVRYLVPLINCSSGLSG